MNPLSLALALILTLAAGPALAATITATPAPVTGTAIALSPVDFVGAGPCGSGHSLVTNGCSVALVSDPGGPTDEYGRPHRPGIDSQDRSDLTWAVSHDTAFDSLSFTIADANDRPPSFFRVIVDGTTYKTDPGPNGNLRFFTVNFEEAIMSAVVRFTTKLNDGWALYGASVHEVEQPPAPVPLPAAGLLMLAGLGGLGLWRKRG